ncbi:hypothetical protein [Paenibacillus hamazuiensis]|uniref:hypothetical protein n=1 Tax=Paenibacillus hamazuiensis TaxID=2936508 RepID=UPI00200D62D7|nr:hypothetical protein [Paenibacillus hamazuiensis]
MKLLKWMSKLIVQSCLIVFLCVITTFTAIQLYVDELLRQFNLGASIQPVKPADLLGRWGEQLAAMAGGKAPVPPGKEVNGGGTADKREGKQSAPVSGIPNPEEAQRKPQGAENGTVPSGTEKPAPDDAVAVWSQVSGSESGSDGLKNRDASEESKRVVVSSDDVAKKKDAISSEDKMRLFSLLVSRLPQTELQNISKLAEDGLTESELKELERIVNSYLKPDEYAELMAILNKYQ